LIARSDAFEKIGPFAGIECAEDMEWGQRARHAGFRFQYAPKMIVFHPARRSLRELYEQWDRHTQHFRNMAEGKPAWKLRWALRALAILVSPFVDFTKVLVSDRIQGLPARLKAIMVLFRVRAHRAWTMLSPLASRRTIVWNRDAAVLDSASRD
jgi:GT2 family glycosyltransferase